jgi:uncharacterized phage protein (TIGR01671 family)
MDNRFQFRAWLLEKKKMVKVNSIDSAMVIGYTIQIDNLSKGARCCGRGRYILMQCTGLLATSSYRGESEEDRLIFEGDIVSLECSETYKNTGYTAVRKNLMVAKYLDYCLRFEYVDFVFDRLTVLPNELLISFSELKENERFHSVGIKIIGNVYENSELLEAD